MKMWKAGNMAEW